MDEHLAVVIWNRAAGGATAGSLKDGDRSLAALLQAHGLIMNGGVLNAVEVMQQEEFRSAVAGYDYFELHGVSHLLRQARALVQRGEEEEIESHEAMFDADYRAIIPDDSALFRLFEERLRARPSDFASV